VILADGLTNECSHEHQKASVGFASAALTGRSSPFEQIEASRRSASRSVRSSLTPFAVVLANAGVRAADRPFQFHPVGCSTDDKQILIPALARARSRSDASGHCV